MALRIGVDDEGAVEPFVQVALQGDGVAMIEMAAKGPGVELVNEFIRDAFFYFQIFRDS